MAGIKDLIQKIIIFFLFSHLLACASIQQPMGGPRDTTPPKVLKTDPKNQSTNFNSKKITIEFDEYFNLQNEFKEITISPEMENFPIFKKKQKKLEITFTDSLVKNTTYTINLGEAIADVNEKNVLKNFSYVFSTGPTIDSLSIAGTVINSFTSLPEKNTMVFIFSKDKDSLFGKKKPSIYAVTDTAGKYKISNLRSGDYVIRALKDNNGDKLYQPGEDLIGFQKNTINLTKNRDSVNFELFKEIPPALRVLERKILPDGTILLTFNRSLNNPAINITFPTNLNDQKIIHFNNANDSLKIWNKDMGFDSIKVAISENNELKQTINLNRLKKDTYTSPLIPTDNLEGNAVLNTTIPLKLNFPIPIESFDKNLITLQEDSVNVSNFQIERDPNNLLYFDINYPWKEKKRYEIKFSEGAFTSFMSQKNKYFVKRFQSAIATDYSSLDLIITGIEKNSNYILEFLNEAKKTIYSKNLHADTTLTLPKFRTGRYFIRVIYDLNNNGKWDTGDLIKKINPEKVWYDPRSFTIRSNWEQKYTIQIP